MKANNATDDDIARGIADLEAVNNPSTDLSVDAAVVNAVQSGAVPVAGEGQTATSGTQSNDPNPTTGSLQARVEVLEGRVAFLESNLSPATKKILGLF
jgi:hypothetical protein